MAAHWWALRLIQSMEDRIVATILRQPGFHRAVGKIQRSIDERKYGRNPNEPLHPGEATAEPGAEGQASRFFKNFVDELKNQAKGKPTDLPNEPRK